MRKLLAKMNFVRGLRFRLTIANAVFLSLLLIGIGFFFRKQLQAVLDERVRDVLNEEWGATKAYLVIHRHQCDWVYDREDDEETLIVKQLQRVYVCADSAGKVLQISPSYQELGKPSPQEVKAALASNQPFWLERTSPDGEPFLLRGGLFVDDNNTRYFVAIGRSLGESRRILDQFTRNYFTLLPLLILAGSLIGWFVASRAITPVHDLARAAAGITGTNLTLRIPRRHSGDEIDNLIQTFNGMVERLQHSFEMTRQFSIDVSHELRTPLTAIRGQLEVALFTASTAEHYREAIINALQDVERLSQTIRAMLLLSQAESGQLALQKSIIDLTPLVEDFVEQFQIPAEEAEVTLTAALSGPCTIDGDRIQIGRMISNLLSNAVKYTQPKGTVTARLKAEDTEVVFEVEDTGMGIPAEALPHIFDRFYRVPGNREKQGLGLGLSFVAWIVKAHGGTIGVDSAPGRGTRFVIRFPLAAEPREAAEPAVAA